MRKRKVHIVLLFVGTLVVFIFSYSSYRVCMTNDELSFQKDAISELDTTLLAEEESIDKVPNLKKASSLVDNFNDLQIYLFIDITKYLSLRIEKRAIRAKFLLHLQFLI